MIGNPENVGLLMDVPLSIRVEIGKCKKMIKEINSFGIGTIVTLDKVNGELVDVLVNDKIVARGEIVVIDDTYGVRVTSIVHPVPPMAQ
jgi:flagellar motor switch protein FliN/FliY